MIKILERLGVPRTLMLGFLAVAIFMTGDGFELTFLSKFMVDQGFTSSQASLLVTVYGLFAAFGGWSAGVLAEMFGARKVMMFGVGPQEAHFEMNTYDIYKKQLTIQGSFINPLTFRDAISLVSSGKMNIGGLISHELELEQVQDFLDGKITGVSKAVVKVGK